MFLIYDGSMRDAPVNILVSHNSTFAFWDNLNLLCNLQ